MINYCFSYLCFEKKIRNEDAKKKNNKRDYVIYFNFSWKWEKNRKRMVNYFQPIIQTLKYISDIFKDIYCKRNTC